FVDSGYDLKRLIATIMSSKAYQLRAVPRIGEQPRDYLFRGPEIRRLTAEQFGDAIGAITGDWNVYQPTASMLQGLELVNGERVSNWLLRGARNMLGELPPPPAALFVAPINARGAA